MAKGEGTPARSGASKTRRLSSWNTSSRTSIPSLRRLPRNRTARETACEVTFKPGNKSESGRIFWIYDRGPDGSAAYLEDMIPRDNWKDMKYDPDKKAWTVTIDLKADASQIDFFSNHRKTISHKFRKYPTYISSPYTRVTLK